MIPAKDLDEDKYPFKLSGAGMWCLFFTPHNGITQLGGFLGRLKLFRYLYLCVFFGVPTHF